MSSYKRQRHHSPDTFPMKSLKLAGILKQRFTAGQIPTSSPQRSAFFSRMSPGMDTSPPSRLQEAFDYAKSCVKHEGALSAESVSKLRKLIGSVPLEELGFSSELLKVSSLNGAGARAPLPKWSDSKSSCITYLHIYEDEDLTMGIFCFPPNATIPLHNHPEMTVVSRLLFGTLRVKSFDWAEDGPEPGVSTGAVAKLVSDDTLSAPSEPFVLYPDEGNIHSFTAKTPCAVLDVLSPPYAPEFGRDCTYYEELELNELELQKAKDSNDCTNDSTRYVYLKEYEPPSDFEVTRGRYVGRQVKSTSNVQE